MIILSFVVFTCGQSLEDFKGRGADGRVFAQNNVMKATRDLIEDGLCRRKGLVKGLVRAFRDS